MNLVTFTADRVQQWGVTAMGGVLALSGEFPQWKTLRGVIAAGAIPQVLAAGAGRAASHTDFT